MQEHCWHVVWREHHTMSVNVAVTYADETAAKKAALTMNDFDCANLPGAQPNELGAVSYFVVRDDELGGLAPRIYGTLDTDPPSWNDPNV